MNAKYIGHCRRMNLLSKEANKWMIITDFDGTIVDSESANFSALQQILEESEYANHRTAILKVLAKGMEVEEIMKLFNVTPEIKTRSYPL